MSAITNPESLGRFIITTLTFEEIAGLDRKELGAANDPYAVIGLTISKAVVQADANLNSSSRGVALKSTRFPPETNQSQIELCFAKPQGGLGFFYRATGAAWLTIKVFDSHEIELEEALFSNREGYAGMIRARAEIGIVSIAAKIKGPDAAQGFSFCIDDLSFGRELKGSY